MADEILEIGARVDFGAVSSGMQEAASSTAAATGQMSGSFDNLAVATRKAILEQTNLRGVIRQIASGEIQSERIEVMALSDALQRNAQASALVTQEKRQLAVVEAEVASSAQLAAVAIREEAEASELATVSTGNLRQSMSSATGAVAIFEGRLPTRALSRMAATSATLAPILEAAFPAIAAIALGEVVIQVAGKMVTLYNETFNYSEQAKRAATQEAELTKQFENTIGVSDRLIQKLAELRAGQQALTAAGYSPGGAAPTANQLRQESTGERIGGLQYSVSQDTNKIATLKLQLDDASERANKLHRIIDGIDYGNVGLAKIQVAPLDSKVDNTQKELENAQNQQNIDQAELQKETLRVRSEGAAQAAQQARQATSEAKAAASAKMAEMQEEFADLKAQGDTTAKQELAFWQDRITQFQIGSAQYRQIEKAEDAVNREASRAAAEAIKHQREEDKRSSAEDGKIEIEVDKDMQKQMASSADAILRTGKTWDTYWASVAKGQEITIANADAVALVNARAAEASGSITKLGALQIEAAIHAREHTQEIAALAAELARLQAQTPKDALGNVEDSKAAEKIQQLENQIAQLQGKGATQGASDQAAIAAAKAAPYNAATKQISSGLDGALASWERGQGQFGRSFEQTLGGMVISLQGHLLQMGAMWLAHEFEMRVLHITTNAIKSTSDVATAGVAKGVSLEQGLAQARVAAGTAAMNTWAATSAIPIIGPALAPVAASAAYVGVLGLTALFSAAGGWDAVPADNTLANLHKNEMVLPASLADRIRSSTGGNSQSITNNFGGNTFSGGGMDFPAMLDKHEDALAYKMKSLQREGKA